MAALSKAALSMLEDAGCTEVADDYIMLFNSSVVVLLSHRAVSDLNRQARDRAGAEADERTTTAAQAATDAMDKPLTGCAADRDGDCSHPQCPQARDGEPHATGRHCPLDNYSDED